MGDDQKNMERRKENIKFVERLHNVELAINTLVTESKAARTSNDKLFTELSTLTKDHNEAIYGGPKRKGIREDVNNLKKAEDRRDKHIMVLYGALIVTFIKVAVTWVSKTIKGG